MWIEETPNGKFKYIERYEDYLTGQIKRVSVTLDKDTSQAKKTAQAALTAKIDSIIGRREEKKVTLKDLVDEYRKNQKLTVKQSTYTRNFFACKTIMGILGEFTLVNRLTAKYVRDKFLATGKSNGTLNEHMTRFKALIRWGYQNDFIVDISFLDKIEPFKEKPHREKIQDKYLESRELKTLLDGMDVEAWKLITEFLVFSGLRFGEAAALRQSDVSTEDSTIHVSKTYDSVNCVTTTPKTFCSIRDVYMQKELMDTCKKIKSYMLRQRLMYGYKDSGLFLCNSKGQYIKYYAYNKYLKENSLRLIGREITVHALRHTHASLLLENEVSIDTISRRLGHENSKVTRDIYLHITEKLKEKDNEQIANIRLYS